MNKARSEVRNAMQSVKDERSKIFSKVKRDFAINAVQGEGIKICYDQEAREMLRIFLLPLVKVFHCEITESRLSLIYLYRQSEQIEKFSKCDGQCNIFDVPPVAAIGLSIEMMQGKWEYAVMVFIHELTHLKYLGTDERFFPYMDELLKRFNDEMGTRITNDYKESTEEN